MDLSRGYRVETKARYKFFAYVALLQLASTAKALLKEGFNVSLKLANIFFEETAAVKHSLGYRDKENSISLEDEIRLKVWEKVIRETLGEATFAFLLDFVNREVEREKGLREFRGQS